MGDGREGIPFFQLTGRAQYDTLSVDDISATVITLAEERRIPHGNDGADRGGLLHFAFAGYAAARLRHHAERRAFERRATLTERGWIVSLGDESEGRKKEYQITPAGREAVRAELRRLHELTQNGDKLTSEWN